ncbi:MAG: hypothetical protein ABIE84_03545 [bacterium]
MKNSLGGLRQAARLSRSFAWCQPPIEKLTVAELELIKRASVGRISADEALAVRDTYNEAILDLASLLHGHVFSVGNHTFRFVVKVWSNAGMDLGVQVAKDGGLALLEQNLPDWRKLFPLPAIQLDGREIFSPFSKLGIPYWQTINSDKIRRSYFSSEEFEGIGIVGFWSSFFGEPSTLRRIRVTHFQDDGNFIALKKMLQARRPAPESDLAEELALWPHYAAAAIEDIVLQLGGESLSVLIGRLDERYYRFLDRRIGFSGSPLYQRNYTSALEWQFLPEAISSSAADSPQ